MAYRKIEVKGIKYEYVIGRSNTKIKGIGVFDNAKIGTSIGSNRILITPLVIRSVILNEPIPKISFCSTHNFMTHGRDSVPDPYMREIHDEIVYVEDCPKCIHESEMDI